MDPTANREGMGMRRVSTAAVLLGLCCAAGSAMAGSVHMYRSVDANGNVTFSQTPPADASKTKKISVQVSQPPPAPAAPSAQQRGVEAARRAAREYQSNYDARERLRATQRRKNCETAQANLRILRSAPRVQATDAEGHKYFLDPKAMKQRIMLTEQQIARYCR